MINEILYRWEKGIHPLFATIPTNLCSNFYAIKAAVYMLLSYLVSPPSVFLCFSAICWHQDGAIPVNGKAIKLCCFKYRSVTWVFASRSFFEIEQCHRKGKCCIFPFNIWKIEFVNWIFELFLIWFLTFTTSNDLQVDWLKLNWTWPFFTHLATFSSLYVCVCVCVLKFNKLII